MGICLMAENKVHSPRKKVSMYEEEGYNKYPPGISRNLDAVKVAMDYEDRITLRDLIIEVEEKLTPVFEKGDVVRSTLSNDSKEYTVEYRLFDRDREVFYYNSADNSHSFEASELELIRKKD